MAPEPFSRLQDPLAYERRFWSRGVLAVAGVDEAGRGPLAGPVLAAAVVLRPGVAIPDATDSKLIAPERREALNDEILRRSLAVAVGAASAREIDRLNIRRATALAMSRALARLAVRPDHVVVDGLPLPELGWEHEAIVDGDALVHSVACASIVAKVCRDRLMRRLAERYPGYGWHTNVGYATREHRDALRRLGPTPHHRRTYGGVQLDLEV